MSKDLKNRTKTFAHPCVKLAIALPKGNLGSHIERQLIRCSTSLAANYRAACIAQTKRSFVAKLSIAIEEADESIFWIEFLTDEQVVKPDMCENILNEAK